MEPTIEKGTVEHSEKLNGSEIIPSVPNPEAERRLVRKLDRTILPWIMLLYLLSYIDRYHKLIPHS